MSLLSRFGFTRGAPLGSSRVGLVRAAQRGFGQSPARIQGRGQPKSMLESLRGRRAISTGPAIGAEIKGKSSFPQVSDKRVAYWLLGSAASVFGIVILGGFTRLTESGLSITEWKPVTGSLPPLTDEDWQVEFDKYRSSPEFQVLNSHMNLQDFKKIYWMEWAHRVWGRVIGLTFVIPTAYLIARRRVSAPIARRLVGISALIGLQGYVGWWMVKSGLGEELLEPGSHPRVSQYRLATHLGLAFIVYCLMLTTGLRVSRAHGLLKNPGQLESVLKSLQSPIVSRLRPVVGGIAGLVFTTAMSGALVAGIDAGLVYNEFPFMGNGLTPPSSELWDERYAHLEDKSDLWWRNMTANPSLVQLDHRILATTTFTAICSLWVAGRSGRYRAALPRNVLKGIIGTFHLALLQVVLGISTLIYLVPTWLAGTHQAGSLALLTGVLVLRGRMALPSGRVIELVRSRAGRVKEVGAKS